MAYYDEHIHNYLHSEEMRYGYSFSLSYYYLISKASKHISAHGNDHGYFSSLFSYSAQGFLYSKGRHHMTSSWASNTDSSTYSFFFPLPLSDGYIPSLKIEN
jgi:hypothetical protein